MHKGMLSRVALTLMLFSGFASVPAASAQQETQPQAAPQPQAETQQAGLPIKTERVSTEGGKNEVPRIAISATNLHTTWKWTPGNTTKTAYSEKVETADGWPAQRTFGGDSKPALNSFHTSDIAAGPDGTIAIVWVDETAGNRGQTFFAQRLPGQAWSNPVKLSTGASFAHYPTVTIDNKGRIWTAWSALPGTEVDSLYLRWSFDGGKTWLPNKEARIDSQNAQRPWLASGPDGNPHLVWHRGAKDWDIMYSRWNGTGFTNPEVVLASDVNADASITVDRENTVHIAFRHKYGDPAYAIYQASRSATGTGRWSLYNVVEGGNIDKPPVIYADERNGLHLTWYDTAGGREIWYAYRRPNSGTWEQAINVTRDGNRLNFNPDIVARSDAGGTRAHLVYESWYSSGTGDVRIEKAQVGTAAASVRAVPVLAGQKLANGQVATNNPVLSLSFASQEGNPNQFRYAFDRYPTDQDPWLPLQASNPINSPVGEGACASVSLYTQVRNTTTNAIQALPSLGGILVDRGIQSSPYIGNPLAGATPANGVQQELGVNNGDARFIRTPQVAYLVNGEPFPCTGVAAYFAPGQQDTNHPGSDLDLKIIPLQTANWDKEGNGFAERDVPFSVTVQDAIGNQQTFQTTLRYDDDAPVVRTGVISATNNSGQQYMGMLDLSKLSVVDADYAAVAQVPEGKQYWGVWVLVTTEPLQNPGAQEFISRKARVIPVDPARQSVDINLLGGSTTPGQRYVYVRVLDGAGNPSGGDALSTTATLAQGFALPTLNLPIISR